MPELSRRAQQYLKSLERRPFVSTATVKQALMDHGYPANELWLDFHQRYAGYCEIFGVDGATWGLMHTDTRYSLIEGRAKKVDAYKDESDNLWYVALADCHPSYDYTMDERGHCSELSASTFNIYLEREGLYREFMTQGEKPGILNRHAEITHLMTQTVDATLCELSSDEYRQWWHGKKMLAEFDVESGRWLKALRR